ncbi:SurA N-terminal domain-containing protein [Oceanobacillus limi]|uniref:SurA N-terminal domain-containing protein n=1 Tax=Oceanobacillus limi TaxID=930131 RepID=A0A1I0AY93_9BACI|nr:SurA N-terminal domain-containing protein [Oceanobacillus limi]SES98607.1 SurA N-terminal domain-containing protein [Oceanobacillus limi]
MKKLILLILSVGLAGLLVACGDNEDAEDGAEEGAEATETGQQEPPETEVTEEEKVAEDEVVATINGEEVLGNRYNPIYSQTKMNMAMYGLDTSDKDALKEQTVNELVAQVLIKQEAEDKGIEVTEEEVQTEMESIEEEELESYLEQFQLTEAEFKEQINFNVLLNKYMDQELTVDEVSDEEVEERYDQLVEQSGEEIGELEELEETIRQDLKDQKQSEQLQAKLEELQEQAEVEKLI